MIPSGPDRRRRLIAYILKYYLQLSKKSFVLLKFGSRHGDLSHGTFFLELIKKILFAFREFIT